MGQWLRITQEGPCEMTLPGPSQSRFIQCRMYRQCYEIYMMGEPWGILNLFYR